MDQRRTNHDLSPVHILIEMGRPVCARRPANRRCLAVNCQ
ncbi:Uncharacterised protein [Bordetella pertussis]|nr:Uncharacterised protein [Bordetella pertussis]